MPTDYAKNTELSPWINVMESRAFVSCKNAYYICVDACLSTYVKSAQVVPLKVANGKNVTRLVNMKTPQPALFSTPTDQFQIRFRDNPAGVFAEPRSFFGYKPRGPATLIFLIRNIFLEQ